MGDAAERPKNRLQPNGRRTDCSLAAEEKTAAEEPEKKLQPKSHDQEPR